ncbi:hypothetical protein [Microcoleus sp. herbarium12]
MDISLEVRWGDRLMAVLLGLAGLAIICESIASMILTLYSLTIT